MHPLLGRTLALIDRHVAGLTATDFDRHLPGKWSAAGILEHLAITFEGTRRNFQKCLDTGTRRATRPTLRQRMMVCRLIELGWFPKGVQAPERTMPTGLSGQVVVDAIHRGLPAMDAVMAECETRFGSSAPIADHPILGPLSLRQWRRFHWVHTRHHMKQVRALQTPASDR